MPLYHTIIILYIYMYPGPAKAMILLRSLRPFWQRCNARGPQSKAHIQVAMIQVVYAEIALMCLCHMSTLANSSPYSLKYCPTDDCHLAGPRRWFDHSFPLSRGKRWMEFGQNDSHQDHSRKFGLGIAGIQRKGQGIHSGRRIPPPEHFKDLDYCASTFYHSDSL